MEKTFIINGKFYKENCLPGLNDLLREAERHPQAYNRLKKSMEYVVMSSARQGLKGWKPSGLCAIDIVFVEKSKGQKRDYDNVVSGARKIINDALVKIGVLADDSPKYLLFGNNEFEYADNPHIVVTIREVNVWQE